MTNYAAVVGLDEAIDGLDEAIDIARRLNEPGEINAEYARGQAELIVDLFGLDMDPDRDTIYKLITHQEPTS